MGANLVNLLFESWRRYINEVGDPDDPDDNSPELEDIAKEMEIRRIKDTIVASGFNHDGIGHRMSAGRPWIKYKFDESSGVWNYTAYIPNDLEDVDNWDKVPSKPAEKLTDFLGRVGDPYQLKLGV